MDLKAIQEAIRTLWVLPASGLGAGAVYFADQDVPSPAPGPCISIGLSGPSREGVDEVTQVYDAGAALGQEIALTVSGQRTIEVMLQAFCPSAVAQAGANDARELLSKVDAALMLPTIRPLLNAAGIGVLKQGNVQWVPAIHRAGFEGRATLETVITVTETATASVGYIQTVKGTRTIKDKSTDVGVPYTVVVED
jgi:hypothetical protein